MRHRRRGSRARPRLRELNYEIVEQLEEALRSIEKRGDEQPEIGLWLRSWIEPPIRRAIAHSKGEPYEPRIRRP